MALEIKGTGDYVKHEFRDRGPARLSLRVAPNKDKDGKWRTSFLDLSVWPDKPGEDSGAGLLTVVKERDVIEFTAKGRTEYWEKDGQPQSRLSWTMVNMRIMPKKGADTPQRQVPDDGDSVPF